jgi:hypothetical protein
MSKAKSRDEYQKLLKRSKYIPAINRVFKNTSYVPSRVHGQYQNSPPKYDRNNLTGHHKKIFDMYKIQKINKQMKYNLESDSTYRGSRKDNINKINNIWSMYKGIIRSIFNRIYELFISQSSFYNSHEVDIQKIINNGTVLSRKAKKDFNWKIKHTFGSHLHEISKLCLFIIKNSSYYKQNIHIIMRRRLLKSNAKDKLNKRKIEIFLGYMTSYINGIIKLAKYIYSRIIFITKYYDIYLNDNINLKKFLNFKNKSLSVMSELTRQITYRNTQRDAEKNYHAIYSRSNQKLVI